MGAKEKISRRDFLRASAVGAAGILAAACVPVTPEVEKVVETPTPALIGRVTVRASHWWGTFMKPSFDAAEKVLPIKVIDEMTPHGEYAQKLLTQLAGGVAPDMIEVDAYWFGTFWPSGRIMPLDDLVADRDMTKWGIDPYIENAYHGKLYGLSIFYPEQPTLWINREMTDKEGIRIPNPGDPDFDTWTWDDLVEVLKALTKRKTDGTVEQWGITPLLTGLHGLGVAMAYQSGGWIFDTEDNYGETEILLTTPEVVESFQLRVDLIHKHKVAMTPDESRALGGSQRAWSAGKVAITETWGNPQNIVEHPFHYDHLPLPYVKQKVLLVGGNCWSLNKDSKVLEEAFELMWFVTTDDMWAQFRADSYHNPAYDTRNHIDRMPEGINKDLAEGVVYRDPKVKNPNFEGGGDGVFRPRWLGEKAAMEILRRVWTAEEEMVLGKKSVEQALADAKADIDPLLKKK